MLCKKDSIDESFDVLKLMMDKGKRSDAWTHNNTQLKGLLEIGKNDDTVTFFKSVFEDEAYAA